MKLKDYIKKHQGEMAKIGMGSGFFFMGRLRDATEDYIATFDEQFVKDSERRQKNREKEMKQVRKLLKEHLMEEKMHDDVTLRNLCDRYVSASDSALKEKIYRAKYVNVLEREISSKYPSLQTNERYVFHVLILDGDEQGKYWLYDEWLADHVE